MEKKMYFKVKIGYGEMDFINITQENVAKAIKSQVTGMVLIANGGSISGNNIIAVLPDWNKELGLNPEYKLTGRDMQELGAKRKAEYEEYFEKVSSEVVASLSAGGQKSLTGGKYPIHEPVLKINNNRA